MENNNKNKIVLLIGCFFIFYLWVATKSSLTFHFEQDHRNYYHLLTDAFINRKLDLLIKPPQGLIELKNPYDPETNGFYRWHGFHDLSYYKEKLYLYFGPTPVLLLYVPYKLLFNKGLPDAFAIFVFTFATLIFSVLFLLNIKNTYLKNLPDWALLLGILIIGISNLSIYFLHHPSVYIIAISSGMCFLTGALYFFSKSLNNFNLKWISSGSILLGLAIGGRFYLVFIGSILLIFMWINQSKGSMQLQNISESSFRKALIVPFSLCAIAHFLYNYLRFDNIFENGCTYQVTIWQVKFSYLNTINSICPNLYNYLLKPPVFIKSFPFLKIDYWQPDFRVLGAPEPIIGTLFLSPFVLVFFIGIIHYLKNKKIYNNDLNFPLKTIFILTIPILINFLFLLSFRYVTLRYIADYLNLLVLSSCILWFYFFDKSKFIKLFGFVTGIISIYVGIFTTLFR